MRRITEEQRRYIIEHFATQGNPEIRKATGLSTNSILNVAKKAGVTRSGEFYRKAYGTKEIPDEKMDWLVKHFKDTDNYTLADELEISESSLHRLARRFGLKKSRAFMKMTQEEATAMARFSRERYGTGPKKGVYNENLQKGRAWQFKPGENNLMRNGAESERRRRIKCRRSHRETVLKEKMRFRLGLPQKTRLRVTRQPREKILARSYLKNRGYVLDERTSTAFWNETTRRSPRLESRENYPYRFEKTTH